MPTHDFVCEYCGWETTQFASRIGHPCPKNKSESITELIRLDSGVMPVDICCDGCDAERLGAKHHVYTEKVAKAQAVEAGWVCTKKFDYCPRCAAEKGAKVS